MIDVSCKNECASKISIVKAFCFCRGDFCLLRNLMTETPFTRNCYSNIDVMVDEWYSCLLDLLQKSVPIRTKHQESLPPWISPSTSNLMKRKETAVKKLNHGVRHSSDFIFKVQKFSQDLEEAVFNVKREYEISLSDSRNLATIFKYIKLVKSDRSALPTLLNNGKSAVTDVSSYHRLFTKSTPGRQNQWSNFLVGARSQWCSSRVASWTPPFSFHQRFAWFNLLFDCIPRMT